MRRVYNLSHLPALRNDNVLVRPIPRRPRVLHHAHNLHALDDAAEDDVLVVQERRGRAGDEELAAVGVGAGVLVALE